MRPTAWEWPIDRPMKLLFLLIVIKFDAAMLLYTNNELVLFRSKCLKILIFGLFSFQ